MDIASMGKLSEFILDYRKQNAMTQSDLARLLGVTEVTISNIERNKIKAGHRTVKSIARHCGIGLLEVVKLNDNHK